MILIETKEVTEFKQVVIGRKCDVCQKESYGVYFPDNWHRFDTHHNDWGNDSGESYEYHEVCSAECYSVKFKKCVKTLIGVETAKIDGFAIEFAVKLAKLF